MIKKLLYLCVVGFIGVVVVYGLIVVYGTVKAFDNNPYSVPKVEDAQYSIRIKNTGLTFFSDDAVKEGRVVLMNGYWELVGPKYKWRDNFYPLDEGIFGPITVKKRS